MNRTLSIKNLYDIKHELFDFDGDWLEVMGQPERSGAWLIFGSEKNGKTRFAVQLAAYLKKFSKVLYVSAEEGTSAPFVAACQWAGLRPGDSNINVCRYLTLEELYEYLRKRKSAHIIFIDNTTRYTNEISKKAFQQLLEDFPHKLFIFLAHKEGKEPSGALARECKKFARIIVHVEGLACAVSGRCPGGNLLIDEEKAAIYHGQTQVN